MDKKHFIYSGPLIQNDNTFLQRWEQDVWAKSAMQAKTFLINRAKSQFGDAYFNIDLSQLTDITPSAPSGVYRAPRKQKCAKCGTRLTDGGYCPRCDDGAEDLDDSCETHTLREAMFDDDDDFIDKFVGRYVDYIDLNTSDEIIELQGVNFPFPGVQEWEATFGSIDATQTLRLLKYFSPEFFKKTLFHYGDQFFDIILDEATGCDVRDAIVKNKRLRLTPDDLIYFSEAERADVGNLPLPLDGATIKEYVLDRSLSVDLSCCYEGFGYGYVLSDYTDIDPLKLKFKNPDISYWLDDHAGMDFDAIGSAMLYPWTFSDIDKAMDDYVNKWLPIDHKSNSPEEVMAWCIGKGEFTVSNAHMQLFVNAGYNLSTMALNAFNVSAANNSDGDIVLHLDASNITVNQKPLYLPVFDCDTPNANFPLIEHLYLNDSLPMEESIELNNYTSKYDPDEIRMYIKHIHYKNKEITVEELLDAYHRRWEHA
jgi:hypothetical protein